MESTLQNAIIAAITTIISLVVGFGIIDEHIAGLIVAAAGTIVSTAFLIAGELRAKTKVQAAVAINDVQALKRLATR